MARADRMKNILAQAYADDVAEMSLHDGAAGTTGANEITAIDRSPVTFPDPPTAGVIISDPGSFDVPAGTTIVEIGLWDGSGNFLDSFANNVTFADDTTYQPAVRFTQDGVG